MKTDSLPMLLVGTYFTLFSKRQVQDKQMNTCLSEGCIWLCKEHWNLREMTRLNGGIADYMVTMLMFLSLGRNS
jgi:hypothetical protein